MDRRIDYEKKPRTIKSEELLHVYSKYETLLNICLKAKERALTDKSDEYLKKIGADIFGKKKRKNKRGDIINEYFDNVQKDLEDNVVVNLVATFEKLVFNKIPLATNNSKEILSSHYTTSEPFSSSIKSFVKTKNDINNISGVLGIIKGSISTTLENNLQEVVNNRNFIAHGKRFGSISQLNVYETLEILDETIEIVLSKNNT